MCDVTLSLSLKPVPVREDYTPEHTHTQSPNGATVRQIPLSSPTQAVGKVEGKRTRNVWIEGRRIYKGLGKGQCCSGEKEFMVKRREEDGERGGGNGD